MADKEFESLRHDEIEIRKAIERRIKKENIDLPIDLDSLSSYLREYHKVKDVKSISGSQFIKLLTYKNISSIKQLDSILSRQALSKAEKQLSKMHLSCSRDRIKRCLIKYFLSVGDHFHIGPKELTSFAMCPMISRGQIRKTRQENHSPRSNKSKEPKNQ